MAAATFAVWGLDPRQSELACLLVSEVVTNVVLHAALSPEPAARARLRLGRGRRRPRGRGPGRQLGACRVRRRTPVHRVSSSLSACGAVSLRSGLRCSTQTCGCHVFAMLARTMREDAGSTSWTSFPAAGVAADQGRQGCLVRGACPPLHELIGRTQPSGGGGLPAVSVAPRGLVPQGPVPQGPVPRPRAFSAMWPTARGPRWRISRWRRSSACRSRRARRAAAAWSRRRPPGPRAGQAGSGLGATAQPPRGKDT